MKIYNDILRRVMEEGNDRETRNGMTRALFAMQMRFNMADGFPPSPPRSWPSRR